MCFCFDHLRSMQCCNLLLCSECFSPLIDDGSMVDASPCLLVLFCNSSPARLRKVYGSMICSKRLPKSCPPLPSGLWALKRGPSFTSLISTTPSPLTTSRSVSLPQPFLCNPYFLPKWWLPILQINGFGGKSLLNCRIIIKLGASSCSRAAE